MDDVSCVGVEQNVFAMPVAQPVYQSAIVLASPHVTYPKMNPTIDITAAVRPYDSLLASQADGSGNVSINQSWNTGGKLQIWLVYNRVRFEPSILTSPEP